MTLTWAVCWMIRVTETRTLLHRGPIAVESGALCLYDRNSQFVQAFGPGGWLSVEPTDD